MPPDRPRRAARAQNPLTMSSGGEKWQRRKSPARGGAAVGHPPRHPLPRKLRVPDAFCPQGRPWVLSASIRPDQPRVTRRIGARVGSARDPLPRQLADGGEFRRSLNQSPCPAPPPASACPVEAPPSPNQVPRPLHGQTNPHIRRRLPEPCRWHV